MGGITSILKLYRPMAICIGELVAILGFSSTAQSKAANASKIENVLVGLPFSAL
jgi:hypothetical protein